MTKIRVEDAVGSVLAHDMTRIVPGKFKGVGFKKGHVVKAEDISELLKIGKAHVYVLNLTSDQVHEDEAALRIAPAICGDNLTWTPPAEGKSNIIAAKDGLLKVNVRGLTRINALGSIIVSTLKTNFPCKKGQKVAATRIIPLLIPKKKIEKLEDLAAQFQPVLAVKPFQNLRVGGIVTGSEISSGLIKDEFDRYVAAKVIAYGCDLHKKIIVPDDVRRIAEAVTKLAEIGCDLILTTGGLSVDPDDVTRLGIKKAGAKIMAYGSPILPGAMFLYAQLSHTVILGLPACVFYHPTTIFDLVLPRILAGETIKKMEIAEMGHGGLCMDCDTCHFPACPFGK